MIEVESHIKVAVSEGAAGSLLWKRRMHGGSLFGFRVPWDMAQLGGARFAQGGRGFDHDSIGTFEFKLVH